MKLANEFTVAVPLERAWETLLDIERVAGFLPGATIEPTDEEGVFRGRMRIKLGPMVVNYQGTVRMLNVDEAQHIARMSVEAKEAKGQGTASAVIVNQALAVDGGTRVVAETELAITGRQAQFGRGIMQDVAGRMLGEFAKRFESHLADGGPASGGSTTEAASAPSPASPQLAANGGQTLATTTAATPAPAADEEDAIDLGSILTQTPLVRVGGAAAAGVALLLIAGALRQRRKGVGFQISYTG